CELLHVQPLEGGKKECRPRPPAAPRRLIKQARPPPRAVHAMLLRAAVGGCGGSFCTKKRRRYMYCPGSKLSLACLPGGVPTFPFPRGWYRYNRATCAHLAHVSLIFGGRYKAPLYQRHVVQAGLIRSISFFPALVSSQPSRALVIRRPAASAFSARTTRV